MQLLVALSIVQHRNLGNYFDQHLVDTSQLDNFDMMHCLLNLEIYPLHNLYMMQHQRWNIDQLHNWYNREDHVYHLCYRCIYPLHNLNRTFDHLQLDIVLLDNFCNWIAQNWLEIDLLDNWNNQTNVLH